jgi:hypothetical protein
MFLGKPAAKNPYEGMFENFKPFDPAYSYPALEHSRAEWHKVTALLQDALSSADEAHLSSECLLKSPIGDPTNGGTIAFLAQHESYDIGQIAFLKKFHTKDAMKY